MFHKGHTDEIIDKMLIHNLSQMSVTNDGEEELYGRQVTATPGRFTNHQKAIAKLRIQSVVINVKFPDEEQHCMPLYTNMGSVSKITHQ